MNNKELSFVFLRILIQILSSLRIYLRILKKYDCRLLLYLEDVDKPLADRPIDLDVAEILYGAGEAVLQVLVLQRVHPEPEGGDASLPAHHLYTSVLRIFN